MVATSGLPPDGRTWPFGSRIIRNDRDADSPVSFDEKWLTSFTKITVEISIISKQATSEIPKKSENDPPSALKKLNDVYSGLSSTDVISCERNDIRTCKKELGASHFKGWREALPL